MTATPSTVKRRALEQLVSYLQPLIGPAGVLGANGIPLANFYAGDQGTEHTAPFPHIVVRSAGSWEFVAFMDDELWSTTTTQTVQVGDIHGGMELVLGCTNQAQREVIEDLILDNFYRQTDQNGFLRCGVVVVQLDQFLVSQGLNLAQVPVAYCLEQELWNEEQVFERKRFSSLALSVDLPALVTRTATYDMDTLVAALTNDLSSNVPTEQVQVLGTDDPLITLYTGP